MPEIEEVDEDISACPDCGKYGEQHLTRHPPLKDVDIKCKCGWKGKFPATRGGVNRGLAAKLSAASKDEI